MNQQPKKRQVGQSRLNRNNKEDSAYTFQKDQSKWRKKAWSQEEDQQLIKLVAKHGAQRWTAIAESLPGRVGKQCRERWHNHLNPDINKNQWMQRQQWILFLLHKNMGNQWSQFTKHLRGRTDNSIKNHWNSIMKKKASSFTQRYKRIKYNLEMSKQAGDKEIDSYLLQNLQKDISFQLLEGGQKEEQKIRSRQDTAIKSMVTVTKKQSIESFSDLQKTAKKKAKVQNQKRQQLTVKLKKSNQYNFNPNITSRLSQLSVFGPPSKPNIVSAFSLLEQEQPLLLQPHPSLNDLSLSINCFDQQKQQNQVHKQKRHSLKERSFKSIKLSSKQSLDMMRNGQANKDL